MLLLLLRNTRYVGHAPSDPGPIAMKMTAQYILEVDFDAIQRAMEDTARDRFDYYLDRESGDVVRISEEALSAALSALYIGEPSFDPDEDVLYDSAVNLSADLPDHVEESVELALAALLDPVRYMRIPERASREAFECMRVFADRCEAESVRGILADALHGDNPFRAFKAALGRFPQERKKWHAHNAKRMRVLIREWLLVSGIRPVRRRR